MSKYNVGDVIKLRDDLEDDKEYGCGICFVSSMNHLKRKPVVIEVCEKESYGEWYKVEDGYWNITDEMIEGLWEECNKVSKFKLIDVLNMITKKELKENTKIKWDCDIYVYQNGFFENSNGDELLFFINSNECLNDEVELWVEEIKEPKYAAKTIKIEELNINFQNKYAIANENAQVTADIITAILKMRTKLNEVIRVINKKE